MGIFTLPFLLNYVLFKEKLETTETEKKSLLMATARSNIFICSASHLFEIHFSLYSWDQLYKSVFCILLFFTLKALSYVTIMVF